MGGGKKGEKARVDGKRGDGEEGQVEQGVQIGDVSGLWRF